MFGDRFRHFLSYGATDQQTVVALANHFDGLLVPGTVAAFQVEGTGGFVLALSAVQQRVHFAIDPRFPLFQQALRFPKRSHEALADLLGARELIRATEPDPVDFTDELIGRVGAAWAQFNLRYSTVAGAKVKKYANRLGEDPDEIVAHAGSPTAILAPYLMSHSAGDDWWWVSEKLYERTAEAAGDSVSCLRVVAAEHSSVLADHALTLPDDRIALWVSNLDEILATSLRLAEYGNAIRSIAGAGKQTFALYGGFFSVLLHNVGLGGASHGIGYGEQRDWIELPESGPPPARYYVPQLHRYLQPDEATRLLLASRDLAECTCPECNGDPPNTLDYHSLMKHSVHCRAREIEQWSTIGIPDATRRLRAETEQWNETLATSGLPNAIITSARARAAHLDVWVEALSGIG